MIAFRCDATPSIGYGHVRRCLALASMYRRVGLEVVFVMRQGMKVVRDLLEQYDSGLVVRPDHRTCMEYLLAKKKHIQLAVIDHYEIDDRWEKKIAGAFPVMVIDDLCRSHWCDILVDQTFGRQDRDYNGKLHNPLTRRLLGIAYALLDPVYQGVASRRDRGHVLISFGAMDTEELAVKVLSILEPAVHGRQVTFHVPLSSVSPCLTELKRFVSRSRLDINVHTDLPDLAGLYQECGIAIGAPGISLLERIHCGLENLTIVTAQNQEQVGRNFSDSGIAPCLGFSCNLDPGVLTDRFLQMLESSQDAGSDASGHPGLVDGLGPVRVVRHTTDLISPVILRRAVAGDRETLYQFQQENGARKFFTVPVVPSKTEHAAWFEQVMAADDVDLYMIVWCGQSIGYVRLEGRQIKQISILVSQAFKRIGLAGKALEMVLKKTDLPCRAEIHPDNKASLGLFLGAGFTFSHGWTYMYEKNA